MPFTPASVIDELETRLAGISSVTSMLDEGLSPEQILDRLIGSFDLQINEKKPVRYACDCSKERFAKALISLGKKELKEMIADGKPVEVNCHFCNKKYSYSTQEVEELYRKAI